METVRIDQVAPGHTVVIRGQVVRVNAVLPVGRHAVTLHGTDGRGHPVSYQVPTVRTAAPVHDGMPMMAAL